MVMVGGYRVSSEVISKKKASTHKITVVVVVEAVAVAVKVMSGDGKRITLEN